MRNILIEKVTVNIGVGEPGQKLEQARDLLGRLAGGKKTLETRAKRREPTFRLRKDLPIGCKVTIRGKEAQEFLDKALTAKRKVIKSSNFDKQGNLSFGISEYIDNRVRKKKRRRSSIHIIFISKPYSQVWLFF